MTENFKKPFINFYIRLFRYFIYKFERTEKTRRLGSIYGGWSFIETNNLNNQTIISGGCGEDISFDIEFLNIYKGRAVLVDPTPRSIAHLNDVINNLGKNKTKDYIDGGNQPIETYNLKEITEDQIKIEEYALYDKDNLTVEFFPPPDSSHVSYSISNWQNVDESIDHKLEVKTITLKELLKKYNIDNLQLIKLDIEGAAENQVLPYMIRKKIFPDQILVEFDELHTLNFSPYFKATKIIINLLLNGYCLIKTNKFPDMLFAKKTLLKYIH